MSTHLNITIVGTGYVGLVTGTCLAEMGHRVTCVDIDEAKIDQLRGGELPIFEPDLEHFFERNRREDRLHFTTELADAVPASRIVFLALPTPPADDGSADLSAVDAVAGQLGDLIDGYTIVVNKSTVPVGTADRVRETIRGTSGRVPGEDFDVVSNPEFLREGAAVDDFMKPDRVIIGTESARAGEIMETLYEPFVRSGNPILIMDPRSAELTKYAANAMLATRISFMNEMARLCERTGADVEKIRIGIGTDPRIGRDFLYAGAGFGGSCFPKDTQALAQTARAHGYEFRLVEATTAVNDRQRVLLADRVIDYFGGDLEDRTIALWGLAFKAHTDDVREAPAHKIIERLLAAGARIQAFDPEAIETTRAVFGDRIRYGSGEYDTLEGAEALIVCTEWPEFRRPDFEKMARLLDRPVVFDGRNLYDPRRMAEQGFHYYGIGRPHIDPETGTVHANGQALDERRAPLS